MDDLSPAAKLLVEDCPELPPRQAQRIVDELLNQQAPLARFLLTSSAAAIAAYRATEGPWLSTVATTFFFAPFVTSAIPMRKPDEVSHLLASEYGVDRKISAQVAASLLSNARVYIAASAVAATLPALFIRELKPDKV